MLARVYNCQNATLLEITCRGSYVDRNLFHVIGEEMFRLTCKDYRTVSKYLGESIYMYYDNTTMPKLTYRCLMHHSIIVTRKAQRDNVLVLLA